MAELVTLNGKFTHIIYRNDANFFTISKFRINDERGHNITVTGTISEMEVGVVYDIQGTYVEHPKYGVQFKLLTCSRPLPAEQEGIIRYLSSSKFPGIGKKMAETIVNALGKDCLKEIKENPDILLHVPKITKKQYDSIVKGVQEEDSGLQELVQFMNIHGIGNRNLSKISETYGKDALFKIKENPYQLVEDIDGIGFKTADEIGMSLGFDKNDPKRIHAFLVSLVNEMTMNAGDSYIQRETLEASFLKKTRGLDVSFDDVLEDCILSHSLICEEDHIYPKAQYEAERTIADYLKNFPYSKLPPYDKDLLKQYLDNIQKENNITYDASQIEAIENFFENPFFIMTGGPGTGKTTVVKALVTLFHLLYPEAEIVCVAPTGRAAKRLAELTETKASTIHSLLQWNLNTNEFNKNEDDPIYADLLIIDEFSMVDTYLFSNLLKASRHVKKICIIGDEDQLPSVSPGSVLRDLIASEVFPLTRLHHIYRQKEGSGVIALAHDIREGNVDFSRYTKDVSFIETDTVNIKNAVIQIVQSALDKNYSFDDIQVLSPMYASNAGITILNNALQEKFNPPSFDKKEVRHGYMTFREGDKILQLKNQTEDDVYNGDIGNLVEIIDASEMDDHKTTIVVDFQGNFVEYKPEDFINITLAYCISVHKSQGSEYPIVIMPFTPQHTYMLQKRLIYTACSRSARSLILVGEKQSFLNGIFRESRGRLTGLKDLLKKWHHLPKKNLPC